VPPSARPTPPRPAPRPGPGSTAGRAPRAPRAGPRAERTRKAILAAAERIFAERGFAAARLEDVAEAVGIRRASIVYHFRDKPALYDAVLADALGALLARLEPALLGPLPLARRAEAAVSVWVDVVAERPTLARLLLREAADATPQRTPAVVRHTRPFFALVERVVSESAGQVGTPEIDPAVLASQVAGATVFLVAAMPALLPGLGFERVDPERIDALRRELVTATRRLLPGA
jgi:TetR/AcrR family transcriptional regulator